MSNSLDCSTPSFPVFHHLLEFAQTHVHWVHWVHWWLVMPSNHFILCCPLLFLPSVFPSIRVFSNESVLCIRWSKYWSFSISPSNEYSELISLRIDWFDLLAVQGTLTESSLAPQFKSINSSVFSLLYDPTLTSVHDSWKKHSFENMDLCWWSDVSAFEYAV